MVIHDLGKLVNSISPTSAVYVDIFCSTTLAQISNFLSPNRYSQYSFYLSIQSINDSINTGLKMSEEKRPEWMSSISGIVNPDDYLLGRKIDKTFELYQQEKAEKARELRSDLIASDKLKLVGDPILDLERRKYELKLEIISNPVRLRQLREQLLREEREGHSSGGPSSALEKPQDKNPSTRAEDTKERKNTSRRHRDKSRERSPSRSSSSSSTTSSSSSSSYHSRSRRRRRHGHVRKHEHRKHSSSKTSHTNRHKHHHKHAVKGDKADKPRHSHKSSKSGRRSHQKERPSNHQNF